DMAYCPAYLGHICSLCCSLDARCNDMCKPEASWSAQWQAAARALLPAPWWRKLDTELGRYLLLTSAIVPLLGLLFYMIYQHELRQIVDLSDGARDALAQGIGLGFMKVYAALVVVSAIVTWWLVLTHKSRQVAQEESNRQTQALNEQAQALRDEIESHQRTDEALQQAKRSAELANQAKSRYLPAIRHEVQGSLPEVVRTDEKRMRQILINVIGNAVKFTSAGQVVFRLSYAREMAVFEIEDTGPGIAPHEIEQVFEPFARGSASGATS